MSVEWARWRLHLVSVRRLHRCQSRWRIRRVLQAPPGRLRTRLRGRPRRDRRVGRGQVGTPRARTRPLPVRRLGRLVGRAPGPQSRRSVRTTRQRVAVGIPVRSSQTSPPALTMPRLASCRRRTLGRLHLRRNRFRSPNRSRRRPMRRTLIRLRRRLPRRRRWRSLRTPLSRRHR